MFLQYGLVSYWPFNGNANDESGNGNIGTVKGKLKKISQWLNNLKQSKNET